MLQTYMYAVYSAQLLRFLDLGQSWTKQSLAMFPATTYLVMSISGGEDRRESEFQRGEYFYLGAYLVYCRFVQVLKFSSPDARPRC